MKLVQNIYSYMKYRLERLLHQYWWILPHMLVYFDIPMQDNIHQFQYINPIK